MKRGGDILKNFFGSIFINRDELSEAGINYPIKVEYYKITDEDKRENKNKPIYGIQIIKTEYRDKIGVEQNKIEHLTNDEKEITKMLGIVKENEVTPIGLEDVIIEIKKLQALAKNKKLSYNTQKYKQEGAEKEMTDKLIIVESPAKANTIKKFLGGNTKVVA